MIQIETQAKRLAEIEHARDAIDQAMRGRLTTEGHQSAVLEAYTHAPYEIRAQIDKLLVEGAEKALQLARKSMLNTLVAAEKRP